jgi:mono/diheme cytochrome c family protein
LACHGAAGLGDGPSSVGLPAVVAGVGLPEVANAVSPQEWYRIIYEGNIENIMPPFAEVLSANEIWDVIAYLYTLSAPSDILAEGQTLFVEYCAACHGEAGDGSGLPGAADLTDSEYMVTLTGEMIIEKIKTGNGNPSHAFGDALDPAQQFSLMAYVRSFVFGNIEEDLTADVIPTQESTAEPSLEPTEAPTAEPTEPPAEPTAEVTGEPAEPTAESTAEPTEEPTDEEAGEDLNTADIYGTVTNATTGEPAEGLIVTLYGYDHMDLAVTLDATLGEDGSFRFEELVFETNFVYYVTAEYLGVSYSTPFYFVEGEETEVDFSFDIYEITSDTSDLVIEQMNIAFVFQTPDTVQVIQMISISNLGDRTIVPSSPTEPVLHFNLPENATNLLFEQGQIGNPYMATASGFADPSAVVPGENSYQVVFGYNLPYTRSLAWSYLLNIPLNLMIVHAPDAIKLESDLLQFMSADNRAEALYNIYSSSQLPAGTNITIDLSGRNPMSGGLASFSSDSTTLIIGVFALALGGLAVWYMYIQPKSDEYEDEEFDSPEALMDEIIALDEAYENGKISQAKYERERAALKDQLRELVD